VTLRSFRMENHRSFRGEAELSFLPAYAKGTEAVPVAAIYGANAAGKSNLLDGLRFMSTAVDHSYRFWAPESGVHRSPFRLDPAQRGQPSTYVIDVVLAGTRYVYGFMVDDEQVREEWLYSYPKTRRRTFFERRGTEFELGHSLGGGRAKADVLAELTRPNALFLSLAAQVGIAELMPVYDWFVRDGLRWVDDNRESAAQLSRNRSLANLLDEDNPNRAQIITLLRSADVGIDEVFLEKIEKTEQPSATERVMEELIAEISRNTNESESSRIWVNPKWHQEIALRSGTSLTRIRFRHGDTELFDLADESAGTRSWLALLPEALAVLDNGGLLMIDEIDSSLHPNLTALLVRQFQAKETNPHGAQLLFTTHDATLLGTSFGEELLARDQVWFVEKDREGASRLYPLTDFHPRTGENRERRYLTGSYGGVPVITSPDVALAPGTSAIPDRAAKAADA
jgi:AAA15 family ATPase/GTPase